MADICDSSDNEISAIYQLALKKANSTPSLVACGACHYCGEATQGLFCSKDCRDDHEYEQAARRRNHGAA